MTENLAERLIVAAAEAWRGNGEILASGIGVIPRIAVGLAKLSHSPELMLTDGEAYLIEEPVPIGEKAGDAVSGWMSYGRVFDLVWAGARHAMVTPTQIDRYGQTNISCLGDHTRPKVQMLGVRGFPGNTVNHINSMFVPGHSSRVFVGGEVDMVAGAGYKPGAFDKATRSFVDLRIIVTDLCVMDFAGADHAVRVTRLSPGVSFEQVQQATGFELVQAPDCRTLPEPTADQLAIIRRLDPGNARARVLAPR